MSAGFVLQVLLLLTLWFVASGAAAKLPYWVRKRREEYKAKHALAPAHAGTVSKACLTVEKKPNKTAVGNTIITAIRKRPFETQAEHRQRQLLAQPHEAE